MPLVALWLAAVPAHAQTSPAMAPSASMPMGQMHKDAAGSRDMKASMMMGLDGMQKMTMSSDADKGCSASSLSTGCQNKDSHGGSDACSGGTTQGGMPNIWSMTQSSTAKHSPHRNHQFDFLEHCRV